MIQHAQMLLQLRFAWYAEFANYLVSELLPPNLAYQQKNRFFHDVRNYQWDDPHLDKLCSNHVIRKYILDEEISNIMQSYHVAAYGGHFSRHKTEVKVLQSSYYRSVIFKDAYEFVKYCDRCQRTGNISQKHEMPLTNILEVESFLCMDNILYETVSTLLWQLIHLNCKGLCIQVGRSCSTANKWC